MNKPLNPRHRPLTNPFTGRELTEGGRRIVEHLLRVANGPDHAKARELILKHRKDMLLVANNTTHTDALREELYEALRLCLAAELWDLRGRDDGQAGDMTLGKGGGE